MTRFTTDSSPSAIRYVGAGVFDILGIIFIVLKLTGVINWPWIWVLAPFWGQLVICVLAFLIIMIILLIRSLKGGE